MAEFRSLHEIAVGVAVRAFLQRHAGTVFTLDEIRAAVERPLPAVMRALAEMDGAPWLGRGTRPGQGTVWWAIGNRKSEAA